MANENEVPLRFTAKPCAREVFEWKQVLAMAKQADEAEAYAKESRKRRAEERLTRNWKRRPTAREMTPEEEKQGDEEPAVEPAENPAKNPAKKADRCEESAEEPVKEPVEKPVEFAV